MSDLTPARIAELRRIATGGYASSYFDRDTILGLLDEIDRRAAENQRLRQGLRRISAGEKEVSGLAGEFYGHGMAIAARLLAAAAPESPDRRE